MALLLTRASEIKPPSQEGAACHEAGYRRGYWQGVLAACNHIICGATQHDVRLWLFRELKDWARCLQDGEATFEPPPGCVRGRSYDESTLHTNSPKPEPGGGVCFVYAIGDGHGHTKIGIANDVYARLRTLQTGNASRLYLICYVAASHRYEAEKIESWCHAELASDRMCGEWFSVFDDTAYQTLFECVDELDVDADVIEIESRVY